TVQRILVEGASRRGEGELMGRTPCNRVVNFAVGAADKSRLIGQLVDVNITAALPHSLRGDIVIKL
ncbi:MAG: TRAM domain-containing protein, partial [Betaproteobacteria bacterium]|nr:TRAM domain-containing protein [Betaproteobacteria bacterium]